LELGVPFSVPIADVPSSSARPKRALRRNHAGPLLGQAMRLRRAHETPIVLDDYLKSNSSLRCERFSEDAASRAWTG